MPELPDLTVYLEHIERRLLGERLEAIRLASPFLLRTVEPTIEEVTGRRLTGTRRLAKQLVLCLEDNFYLVIHLMISGRLQWRDAGAGIPKRLGLAAFDFESGSLLFTEASKKKRASLKIVHGEQDLAALNPGGLEVLEISLGDFAECITHSNHTLKRALTDQHVFAGIGNAYSDEILLRAQLSPFKRPANLSDTE
ncbi:MAG: DNA-formamidopyrimidine glycosylase family protein, partial [Pseudomonadota bacterium]